MNKKVELIVTIVLIIVSVALTSIYFISDLKFKDTKLATYTVIGMILASMCAIVFPKLNTITSIKFTGHPGGEISFIKEYTRDPSSMFMYIVLGYSGLLLWIYSSTNIFDVGWWSGMFFLFLYFQGLITPFMPLPKE